jgi:hypothetical protein
VQRLKQLEQNGVVYIEAKPKGKGHLYRLTPAGEDFRSIVEVMSVWGQRWAQGLTHHPHVHMIVPGGGLSLDGKSWIASRPGFFLSVRVLSRLFRRLFLQKLVSAYAAGELEFFNGHVGLANPQNFATLVAPLRNSEWVVYSKRPFGGPNEVLRYLARYTHRVAISNHRLIACDQRGITFQWKDYRIEGPQRYKVMTLATHEFIRRFLMHVLPAGFHRIRYYGLLASSQRAENIGRARGLLMPPFIPVDAIKTIGTNPADNPNAAEPQTTNLCPCCGGRMLIIERFERGATPHYRANPLPAMRIDTS